MIDKELLAKAVYYAEERKKSFANPPKDCKHEMVYVKEGGDLHCQYCDKFMYTDSGDYDD